MERSVNVKVFGETIRFTFTEDYNQYENLSILSTVDLQELAKDHLIQWLSEIGAGQKENGALTNWELV